MQKRQEKIFVLFILLFLLGCSNENSSFNMDQVVESEVMLSEPLAVAENPIEIERKLIKEGRVEFETKDIPSTRKTVMASVEKYKGYITTDQEYKTAGSISNTLVIRVPAKSFDLLLSDATQGVTKFDSKNIDVKDVTEEFLDIQARLKTKKELENRYLEILKKANKVSELLEVEAQLGELRADIESIEGRLKYLESQVSLSTLTMTFYETVPNETEFGNKFKNGFQNGWNNLIWFFVFLINIWPFILLGIGVLVGVKVWIKRK